MTDVTSGTSPSQSQLVNLLQLYQAGRYGDAAQLALSLTGQFPRDQFSWKVLAAALKQTGKVSEALAANRKAVELDTQDAEAHYNLGNTLQELGRLEDAQASYQLAIRLKPDYAKAYSDLGNTLKKLGQLEDAETSYRQAITLIPGFAGAHFNLGLLLQELDRIEEAAACYRQATTLDSRYAAAHINLGGVLKALGRLSDAEASYKQAIALQPNVAEPHNSLGITLQALNRFKEAEASYNRAIALKPDYSDAYLNRGQLLFEKGDYAAALKDFDACDTDDSRAGALACLCALEREEEIYNRIERQAEIDDTNIKVAAISAFVTDRYKKETAHNFCKNPLNFLTFSTISSHIENPGPYIAQVIEELRAIESVWEPSNQSIHGGFQSHRNFLENPPGILQSLKAILIKELDAYHAKFSNEPCSYIQKWPTGNNLSGWYVILKPQGYHYPHIHPSGWLSGVVYLQVAPSAGENEGAIEFCLGGEHYSDDKAAKITHNPQAGDIVMFPSSLHHRTLPFTADAERIVLAFDLCPDLPPVGKHR